MLLGAVRVLPGQVRGHFMVIPLLPNHLLYAQKCLQYL